MSAASLSGHGYRSKFTLVKQFNTLLGGDFKQPIES